MKNKIIENIVYPLLSLTGFILLWFIVSLAQNSEIILPTPAQVMVRLFALITTSDFYIAILGTLLRTLESFALSFVFALFLGVISGLVPFVYKLLSPLITILRSVPTMSIILLLLVWLSSDISPILVGFLIVFPILYASIYGAIQGVPRDLIEMSNVYQVKRWSRIQYLVLPTILPTIFVSAGSSISLNIKIIIAAEVLAGTRESMGNMMQLAKIYLDTGELLAWTVVAVAISFLLELIVKCVAKLICGRNYS